MERLLRVTTVGLTLISLAACNKSYPGTEEGAKQLLSDFLKPGADHAKLSTALKPTTADYEAVFATKELATKAEQEHAKLWAMVLLHPIKPKEGQTELKMWKATTDELKEGKGESNNFPGGYKDAAAHLKSGLTVYRWKFVKPGETLGMSFDGLYHVNGHWAFVPKPWRLLPRPERPAAGGSGGSGSGDLLNRCKTECESKHGPLVDIAALRACAQGGGKAPECVAKATNQAGRACFMKCRGL
jgi:hypothetical protein